MKYKEWLKLVRKHPHKDLNGCYGLYDSDGIRLGRIVYKVGKVISKRKCPRSNER